MIEKTILDYLNEKLSVPVYMEVPESPPDKFIRIEKTGSGIRDCIYSSMFAIQSYAGSLNTGSLFEAAELNEAVKAAMDAAVELDEICSARLNTDYPFTDTTEKRYRYQAVYDITHY